MMKQNGNAPVNASQPDRVRGETDLLPLSMNTPANEEHLMERVLDQHNIIRAFARVKKNGGSPGIDGMTVEELPDILIHHWSRIHDSLLTGSYQPQPVKRVEIPKSQGGYPKAQGYLHRGYGWVVDIDLEKYFDPALSGYVFAYKPPSLL